MKVILVMGSVAAVACLALALILWPASSTDKGHSIEKGRSNVGASRSPSPEKSAPSSGGNKERHSAKPESAPSLEARNQELARKEPDWEALLKLIKDSPKRAEAQLLQLLEGENDKDVLIRVLAFVKGLAVDQLITA